MPLDTLYISLHTDFPGDPDAQRAASDQTLHEVGYIGYARNAVRRVDGAWLSGGVQLRSESLWFPISAGSGEIYARYFGIGTEPSGCGRLLFVGPIRPWLYIVSCVRPYLRLTEALLEAVSGRGGEAVTVTEDP